MNKQKFANLRKIPCNKNMNIEQFQMKKLIKNLISEIQQDFDLSVKKFWVISEMKQFPDKFK